MKPLTYVINKPRGEISLDLFEAERYEAAVVVQPLIGNLVYYSNHGRYEPRLAESWEREQPEIWTFVLKDGYQCENGQPITATTFKESLEKSILAVSKRGTPPVLNRLRGYRKFVDSQRDLEGLIAKGNKLTFHFDRPMRSGVIEVLSFAPFGFICSENLNQDGTWKDKTKFVSSGPYQVSKIELGREYELHLRDKWRNIAHKNSPAQVRIVHQIPENLTEQDSLIIDSLFPVEQLPHFVSQYKLVPEYLNAVLLGNLEKGYFSDVRKRRMFVSKLIANRNQLPQKFGVQSRAESFFSGGPKLREANQTSSVEQFEAPDVALVIEGKEPTPETFKYESWIVLKKTLEELRIKYHFAGNEALWKDVRSSQFDIRMRGTSVGGGVEAWVLDLLFCSLIGPNYPDPSNRVCESIEAFETARIDQVQLTERFYQSIEEDSAIIPISHFGMQMFMSPNIKRESLSPTLNVMRFDQLEIE